MTITPPRLVRVSVAIMLATTVGILAVGCSTKADAKPAASGVPANTPSGDTVPKLDAVAISDAVLFNQGPAARYLTKLNRPQSTTTDDMAAVRTAIDAKLAADSGFAGSFVTRMQSGDPAQVQSALEEEAKNYVRPVLDARFGAAQVDSAVAAYGDQLGKGLILQRTTDQEFAEYDENALLRETNLQFIAPIGVILVDILFVPLLPDHDLTQATLIRDITIKDIAVGLRVGARTR